MATASTGGFSTAARPGLRRGPVQPAPTWVAVSSVRRKRAGAALILAAAGATAWTQVPGPARVAPRPSSVDSSAAVASPDPAVTPTPLGHQQADPPGACPSGGLEWTISTFEATPTDSSAQRWLVREAGTVSNSSPAAIIVGNGVARVGRRILAERTGTAIDVALTPTGSLALQPGQEEPFSGAAIVDSAGRPTNMGPALSYATWQSPPLLDGCPPPSGSASGSGTLLSVSVS